MSSNKKEIIGVLGFGVMSGLLYFLLFHFEREVLQFTSKGGWSFLLPVAVAFIFSYFHGQFTSRFWDMFNIKAKQR